MYANATSLTPTTLPLYCKISTEKISWRKISHERENSRIRKSWGRESREREKKEIQVVWERKVEWEGIFRDKCMKVGVSLNLNTIKWNCRGSAGWSGARIKKMVHDDRQVSAGCHFMHLPLLPMLFLSHYFHSFPLFLFCCAPCCLLASDARKGKSFGAYSSFFLFFNPHIKHIMNASKIPFEQLWKTDAYRTWSIHKLK